MKNYLSPFLSALLILSPISGSAEEGKRIAKSEQKDGEAKDMPKPKNIDKAYGQEGTLNESKSALISVDSLALQNYSQVSNNFDFSSYDKVTLKSVILETLSHSNDLKSANEKVIQTELSLKEAYASYLPTVDFQYSIKKIHNAETGDDTIDKPTHRDFNEENYKFTLRQSLYSGGATQFKVKSLQSKVEEAKRKYTIVLEEEIQKAIKAYFGVLFNKKSVTANEKNMEKLNKILEITQIKYDSGALSIGDLSAVKANIANASGKLIRVKSDLADAIDFYHYTVGEEFKQTAPYEESFPINLTTLDALYEDILENNLNLVNYRLNIQSAKDKLLNMKATFKPKVDLELNYKNVLDKEDFTANEETYDAKVTLNYNLYNGGKDTIATMEVFSSLQELNFRYQEEIKKLKWEIAKLYNSIKSLEDTLLNTKKEVASSSDMVNSYWEGFQLGDQDLQVLLQGQRQLNGAELDLIKYEQDHLTNVFKLLSSKGELSKYFNIDGNHPDFIDFSNTSGIKQAPKIDLTPDNNKTKNDTNATIISTETNATDENITAEESLNVADLNSTIDTYLEVVKEAGFDNIVNFKDKFLEADDENYTVMISDFTNHYDAYTFAKKNRMLDQSFSYEYFNKNGDFATNNSKTKLIDVKTNLAYGIYNSPEEGQTAIGNIFDKGKKVYKIVKVAEIKELYNKYIDGLEAEIDPFIVKPKIVKTFMTNQDFKNKFLSAPKDYYSINVVSLSQMEQAQSLIKEENIEKDSFVFKYGRNGMWVKIMFGVFPSYEQALTELSKHPEMVKKYKPVIEKIGQKQDTFNTYKEFNPIPQWYLDEQKEKREKKEEKQTSKVNEKKTNTKNEVVASLSDISIEEATTPLLNTTPKVASLAKNEEEKISQEGIKVEPTEDTTLIPVSVPVVVPIMIPTVTIPAIDVTTKIEETTPKETVQMETPTPEVKPTLEAEVTPKTNEVINEKELVAPQQEGSSSFKEAFNNAPREYYTIELGTIPSNQRDNFVKSFIPDNQFTEFSSKGKTQIYYGVFENIEKARERKFKLDPQLIESVKLYKIGRIDQNRVSQIKKSENLPVIVQEETKTPIVETPIIEKVLPKEELQTPEVTKAPLIVEAKTENTTLIPVIVPVVVPIMTSTVTTPAIDVTTKIEAAKPVETVQMETPTPEVKPTVEAEVTPKTNEVINEKEEVVVFQKEAYSSFKEAFKNAPKGYYTIELGAIPSNQRDAFVKRFIIDNQFTEFSSKGKTQIYYGIFENIEKAREHKFNLHPKLIESVKLYQIGRIKK